MAAPGLVGGELLRLLARARHRRNLLVGKRRPPRPARGARVRRGAGDRDDVVVPAAVGPNHGSVIVTVEGERWIVDASILSGTPIRIPRRDRRRATVLYPGSPGSADRPAVVWCAPRAPEGFPCRIDRIGAEPAEWDALHQRTVDWGPFNHQLNARVLRDEITLAVGLGQRFTFGPNGALSASELDVDGRLRFLVEEPRHLRGGSAAGAGRSPVCGGADPAAR